MQANLSMTNLMQRGLEDDADFRDSRNASQDFQNNSTLKRSNVHRLIQKSGEIDIIHKHNRKRHVHFIADSFTTVVDGKWIYTILLFALSYIVSWILFAFIWWVICYVHGDFNHVDDEKWQPCVVNMKTFVSALLFSIETQSSIGYGSRLTTEQCPVAIILMMIQTCVGISCEALLTGIVFVKLSRPQKRAETLMFSKNACICQIDGELCLTVRVADMRKSQIVEGHVRAMLINKKTTRDGLVIPMFPFDVDVGYNKGADRLFLWWPMTVIHVINKESPFFNMSMEDLGRETFELVMVLEGIVESTGLTTQARTSYLPEEILWGHRFQWMVEVKEQTGQYQVDYSLFNNTIPVETRTCSAKQWDEMTRGTSPASSTGLLEHSPA